MKTCPTCGARAFDDAEVCFGCLHRYGEEPVRPNVAMPTMPSSPGTGHCPTLRPKAAPAEPKAPPRDGAGWTVRFELPGYAPVMEADGREGGVFRAAPMRAMRRRRTARRRARQAARDGPDRARPRGRMRGRADRRVLRAMVGFRASGTRLSPRSLVVVGFARRLSGVQAGASSQGAFAARGRSRGVAGPVAGSGAARRPGGEPSPRAAAGADRGGMRGWRVRAFAQRGRSGSALLVSSETMASLPWRPRRNGVRLRRRVVRRFASGRGGVGGSGDGHGCGRDMRSAGEDRAARGVRGPRGGGRRLPGVDRGA